MQMTKRAFLTTATVGAAMAALAGCTTLTSDGKTTVVLDVAKVRNYAQAGLNAAATIAGALSIVPGLAKFTEPLAALAATISADLDKFNLSVGGQVSVSIDTGSTASIVKSILSDLTEILTIAKSVATTTIAQSTGIDKTIENTITTVRDALATIVSLFQLIIAGIINTGSAAVKLPMSEAQALSILKVTK